MAADVPFGLSFGDPRRYMGQSPLAEIGKALKTGLVGYAIQESGLEKMLNEKGVKKYHDKDPKKKCFGGRIIIKMQDGNKIEDELGIADANPWGKRPFERKNYVEKFVTLTKDIVTRSELERFLEAVQNLRNLKSEQLDQLNIEVFDKIQNIQRKKLAIF